MCCGVCWRVLELQALVAPKGMMQSFEIWAFQGSNLSLNIFRQPARHQHLPAQNQHPRSSTSTSTSTSKSTSTMSDEDTYEIPLQDQRVFGAGIKRKRVQFVPSSSTPSSLPPTGTPAKSVSDFYLKLVLPGDSKGTKDTKDSPEAKSDTSIGLSVSQGEEAANSQICEICNLPLSATVSGDDAETTDTSSEPVRSKSRPHEASLAHQVCLTHSFPPSHLDRNRKGLAYLSSYGWDPDARFGLGASGQGIQFPIKTKPKDDKMGIGVVLPKKGEIKKKEKLEKLDAGKVKKLYEKDKKKTERLREMFYQSEDVERYLGKR